MLAAPFGFVLPGTMRVNGDQDLGDEVTLARQLKAGPHCLGEIGDHIVALTRRFDRYGIYAINLAGAVNGMAPEIDTTSRADWFCWLAQNDMLGLSAAETAALRESLGLNKAAPATVDPR
jgi:hypothetical protein